MKDIDPSSHLPPYARIKQHLSRRIQSGEIPVHERVPSENELAGQFGVSRMTARRALQEMTQDGVLVRSQGLGTFVAERKPTLPMLEVRNIADEIAERGHRYGNRILTLESIAATEATAIALGVMLGQPIFHSVMVHLDNQTPVQLEDRYVNPAMAPEYLAQDFTARTPNAYLSQVAPLAAFEHSVEAVLASGQAAEWLALTPPEACLEVTRRTWSAGQVVTYVKLLHPGKCYRLGGYMSTR